MAIQTKLELTQRSKRYLKKFPNEFKKGFYDGLKLSMRLVEKEAKINVAKGGGAIPAHPEFLSVRTGNLRRSIMTDVEDRNSEIIGSVFSNVVYSAVHELGYRNIPARPYLEPAIKDNMERIEDIIEDKIFKEVMNDSS